METKKEHLPTIVFQDDNGQTNSIKAKIIKKDPNFLVLETETNRITIPYSRLYKIKEPLEKKIVEEEVR